MLTVCIVARIKAGQEPAFESGFAQLAEMIAAEPASRPLSDSQLALLLQEQGIQVARRTVAKYRESLNIASSGDRKRFKRSA